MRTVITAKAIKNRDPRLARVRLDSPAAAQTSRRTFTEPGRPWHCSSSELLPAPGTDPSLDPVAQRYDPKVLATTHTRRNAPLPSNLQVVPRCQPGPAAAGSAATARRPLHQLLTANERWATWIA